MKLSECLKSYLDNNSDYLKERTKMTYKERHEKLLKKFGDVDIETFTQDFIQNYIITEQKQQKRKATAVKNDLRLLCSALRPYKTFARFKYLTEECDLGKKAVYTKEDIEKIEEYILKHNKLTLSPIMIAINTGLRLSEIIGLKWEDIDFENRILYVKRNVWKCGKEFMESTPKTKSGQRSVPINDKLFNYLLKIKVDDKNCYVITGLSQSKDGRNIQKTNERLCKKLDIKYCGFHAYRHAFATRLLETSQDFKSISEIMGHSSIAITQNIYNHPTEEQRQNVIDMAFNENKQSGGGAGFEQIKLLQDQINELRAVVARLTQYVQDNIKKEEHYKQMYYNNEMVSVIREDNGFSKIRLKDGRELYVNSSVLTNKIVKPKIYMDF